MLHCADVHQDTWEQDRKQADYRETYWYIKRIQLPAHWGKRLYPNVYKKWCNRHSSWGIRVQDRLSDQQWEEYEKNHKEYQDRQILAHFLSKKPFKKRWIYQYFWRVFICTTVKDRIVYNCLSQVNSNSNISIFYKFIHLYFDYQYTPHYFIAYSF